jgi:hypothetical protein
MFLSIAINSLIGKRVLAFQPLDRHLVIPRIIFLPRNLVLKTILPLRSLDQRECVLLSLSTLEIIRLSSSWSHVSLPSRCSPFFRSLPSLFVRLVLETAGLLVDACEFAG